MQALDIIEYISPIVGTTGTIWSGSIIIFAALIICIPQTKLLIRVTNRFWLASAIASLGLYFVALSITSGAQIQPYLTEDRIIVAFAIRVFLLAAFAMNGTVWAISSIRKQFILE